MQKPNYKKIYNDYILKNIPEKLSEFDFFFQKEDISSLDVIKINKIIFGNGGGSIKNRSYDKTDILFILNHQKDKNLNNSQLAAHFNLSRNTVARWRKLFSI